MKKPITLIIIDDHPMVLTGLSAILETIADFELLGKFLSAESALEYLSGQKVDLLISDIHLPGINGIELCKQVLLKYPLMKVVIMSTFEDRSYIRDMIENGAHGYMSKSISAEELKDILYRVIDGETCFQTPGTGPTQASQQQDIILTRREKEILSCIAQGFTNKELADQLFVSQHTIDSHRKNLLMKFKVQNTAALIAQAAKSGLL
ncbi:MAG: response regulator transcription factor [Chitinophagaceae bacterium]|nr:response regulator transcription factor [Chitinophagaceae bacterium]